MKIGVPTEIKADEYRVALTPAGVRELREHGHEVVVQAGAGEGSAITDADYEGQGARIVPDAAAVFDEAEMILHVKELQAEEIAMLSPGQLGFSSSMMPNIFKGNSTETSTFKGEPTRDNLTQPPVGYQTPSPNYAYGSGPMKPLDQQTPNPLDPNSGVKRN